MTTADQLAAQHGLHRVGGRPPLLQYLGEVWRRREFIWSLAKYRLEAENGRNRLGMGWVVLKPLLNAAVYGLIFGVILQTSRGVDDFVAFLVIGVMMFEFFAQCLTTGARSITANAALVQSLSFPRMSLPLALVAQRFIQFIPMVGVMLVVAMAMGNLPTVQWLLLVPVVVLFSVFNAGVCLFAARLTVHFRDLTQLLPFVARFALYASGILFSVEVRFADRPTILQFAELVPLHEYLTLARDIILEGPNYQMNNVLWLYGTVWAVAMLAFGVVFFWRAEERYGRNE